ncbi:MAG: hypothetical protein ACSHWQ_00125 [Spongiibacteraceae bacterium]
MTESHTREKVLTVILAIMLSVIGFTANEIWTQSKRSAAADEMLKAQTQATVELKDGYKTIIGVVSGNVTGVETNKTKITGLRRDVDRLDK